MARTLFDKLWDDHLVATRADGMSLLHVDRHLIHELTSPQAFRALARAGRPVRNPGLTFAVPDHMIATTPGRDEDTYPDAGPYVRELRACALAAGITLFDVHSPEQGIVHVIGPELGLVLPGMTAVCGDSHTCTLGGLGALAFGIGTSDIEHVLATQTIAVQRPAPMRIRLHGTLAPGVSAKDAVLFIIGRIGAGAGVDRAVEFAGAVVDRMTVEERLTLCNMAVEFSARYAVVAPDPTTIGYVRGRTYAPRGADWDRAAAQWSALKTDPDAGFAADIAFDAAAIAPQVTWGTSPQHVIGVDEPVPEPRHLPPDRRAGAEAALTYMALQPGRSLRGLGIQKVFIGSCTNGRLDDLRRAAAVAAGQRVAPGIRALVVPGSAAVRRAAEAEGLADTFRAAGFEWREPGCSMCAAINGDTVGPGERCVSTSNRNFEHRQGRNARTHLASPAMAAAAAIAGAIVDVRDVAPRYDVRDVAR